VTVRQGIPYALIGLGLVVGLVVLETGPFPWAPLNYLVGATFLAVALSAVTYLIVASSGPEERRPDF
jgi:hypothetical protein